MLSIRNISKVYKPKKGLPVQALKNVSIDFPEKGLVFVLGKSGSGKSTLLNTLGGLDSFDEGEIIIKGKSSKNFSGADFDSYRNTYLGFIFQEYNVLNDFNLEKNIKLALELQGKKGTEEEVAKLLADVDLTGLEKRKVNELSGGQKQRIAIARALIKNPEIILADEPTGALDSATGIQVFDTLKKLANDKLVIVVSHDRDFAERYGDRVIIMKDGVIAEDTTKTYIEPKKLSANVAQIGGNILHVKTNKLSAADIDSIVSVIKKSEGEKIITLGEKENKEVHNVLRFDSESKREAFGETPKQDIKPYTKNDFHLIKSKLRDGDAMKMGVSSLKHKVVRLVFTIVLTVVSLTMFGFFLTVAAYDKNKTLFDSISQSGDFGVAVTKTYEYDWQNNRGSGSYIPGGQDETKQYFNAEDIAKIQNLIGTNNKLIPAYNVGRVQFSDYFGDRDKLNTYAFSGYGNYSLAVSVGDISNPKWLYEPTAPLTDNDIVITDFYYDLYRIAGYKPESGAAVKIEKPADIIGRKISGYLYSGSSSNNYNYTIRGIIDTNFNFDRYRQFYEITESSVSMDTSKMISSYLQQMELQTYLRKMAGAFIMTQGAIDAQNSIIAQDINFYGYTNPTDENNNETFNPADISATNDNEIIWRTGESMATFDTHDIILKCNVSPQPITENGDLRIKFYIKGMEYPTAYTVDTAGRNQFKADITAQMQAELDAETARIIKVIKTEWVYSPNNSYYRQTALWNNDGSIQFSVVGYSLDLDNWFNADNYYSDGMGGYDYYDKNDNNKDTYLNYSVFENVADIRLSLGAGSLIFNLPTNKNDALKIMNGITAMTYTADKYITTYAVSTQFSPILDNFGEALTAVAAVFKWFALAFAIFAALMMMSYIGTSIAFKKREIGILRALGARKSDVYRIFLYESAVVLLIEYVLTVIGLFVAVFFVNRAVQNALGQTLTLLNFGILQMLIILGVGVVVSVMSSILPTARIAGKKPIDAINNK
jgi:ABC-type lipoprotein export system ATPase subunit/ABC-type antimicrobial peptide transport system permease subunit